MSRDMMQLDSPESPMICQPPLVCSSAKPMALHSPCIRRNLYWRERVRRQASVIRSHIAAEDRNIPKLMAVSRPSRVFPQRSGGFAENAVQRRVRRPLSLMTESSRDIRAASLDRRTSSTLSQSSGNAGHIPSRTTRFLHTANDTGRAVRKSAQADPE